MMARWPLEAVQATGRLSERRRFTRLGPHSARESALEAAGLEKVGGVWRVSRRDFEEEYETAWKVEKDFVEVPGGGLKKSLWKFVRKGFWSRPEDIMTLEARAAVRAVERFC